MARRFDRLLSDEAEYDAAVAKIDALLEAGVEEGAADEKLLDYLTVLVEDYDRRHYHWPDPTLTPQEIVTVMLAQHGLGRSALDEVMGGKSRVSEFFSGKRALSMAQVVAIRGLLGIPADLLIFGDLQRFAEPASEEYHRLSRTRKSASKKAAPRKRRRF